ncbi:UNVERIFIED_CONTAM: hypothetical protein HDU68_010707 [Siphonaria sp. JEL0065]|nr:hypothetical protein HDU68_010707 [Siphonaria sp. JEL0065]
MPSDLYIHPQDSETTTIIFNLYKGPSENLRLQLEAALQQTDLQVTNVWINVFGSPTVDEFESVYRDVERELRNNVFETGQRIKPKLAFTKSTHDFKFHGRFLLGFMAKTKYLLIVDDDASFGVDVVSTFKTLMTTQHRGIWGTFGHLRGDGIPNADYRSWPNVNINRTEFNHYEMDYLSGMWFFEQGWLEYFFKERVFSWETGEDIHLSHAGRKYLNLNTYGGLVASGKELAGKGYTATVGKYLELREHMFDHYLGRGNKIADVRPTLDTLMEMTQVDGGVTLGKHQRYSEERVATKT